MSIAKESILHRSRLQPKNPDHGATAFVKERNLPLLRFSQAVFILMVASLALPAAIRNRQEFTAGYIMLSLFAILLSAIASRMIVRLTFPVIILLAMQVWLLITFLVIAPNLVPLAVFGRHLYWPILVVLPYFLLGSICIIDRNWREVALKALFYLCMLSALVALAQFVRVPGFGYLQLLYNPGSAGVDYDGNTPNLYRAVGLTLHPFHVAAQCVFGFSYIASNLVYRRLKWQEIGSMAIFIGAIFVAQSRTYYLVALILLAITLYLLFKRDRAQFLLGVGAMVALGLVLVVAFRDRLSYGFQGQDTIKFGRIERWVSTVDVAREFPITGIGPSADLFGNDRFNLPGRRQLGYTENGYLMMLGAGGIPGFILLVGGLGGCFVIGFRLARNRGNEVFLRRLGFVGALYVVSLAIVLSITNLFEYELLTFLGLSVAAVAASAKSPIEIGKPVRGV